MVLANYEKSLGFLGCVELVNKQLAVHEKLMSEQYFCNNRCDAVKMHWGFCIEWVTNNPTIFHWSRYENWDQNAGEDLIKLELLD